MFVDLLLLGMIIAIAAAGFFQGTVKLLCALVMFYASLLLVGLYYNWAAIALLERGVPPAVAAIISFSALLVVVYGLLLAAGLYTLRYVRLPARLDVLDRLVGTGLGMLLGFVFSSVIGLILRYVFVTHSLASGSGIGLLSGLQNSARASTLTPLLLGQVLPQFYALLSPFLPDAARVLFTSGI